MLPFESGRIDPEWWRKDGVQYLAGLRLHRAGLYMAGNVDGDNGAHMLSYGVLCVDGRLAMLVEKVDGGDMQDTHALGYYVQGLN